MHLDKLTDAARAALELGFARAAELRHVSVEPEHLLLALLSDDNGPAAEILRQLQADPAKVRAKLEEHLAGLPTADHVAASDQYISRPLTAAIEAAEAEAAKRKDRYTSAEQLLVGIVSTKSEAKEILADAGVRKAGVEEAFKALRGAAQPVESRKDEGQVQVARQVHPRPHRARPGPEARPCHRSGRRDPAGHPDPVPADEEQPGAHRGPGGREDRDRRGTCPPDRDEGRSGFPEGEADSRPRPRVAARRGEIPRRVRGAAQGGPEGDRVLRGEGHPLHRRAPHPRPRGGDRGGRPRRLEPPQAGARARNAALHRRDDDPGIPEVHRKGRGPRAPVPAGRRPGAERRGHGLDPARPQGTVRAPPRCRHPRCGARRGRHADGPVHPGPAPPGQGDRRRRRGRLDGAPCPRLPPSRTRPAHPTDPPARDRAGCPRSGEGRSLRRATEAAREGTREPPRPGDRPHGPVAAREGRGRGGPDPPAAARRDEGRGGGRGADRQPRGGRPPPLRHGPGAPA